MRYTLDIQFFAVDSAARALALAAQGGGSGGTKDYNELDNKPKINNKLLIGGKTAEDLDLQRKLTGINGVKVNFDTVEVLYDDKTIKIDSEGKLFSVPEPLKDGEATSIRYEDRDEIVDVRYDDKTIKLNDSENNLYVPIDDMTIFVNSEGKLEAAIEPFIVGDGLQLLDDVLSAKVDGVTIVINSEGAISAIDNAKTDDITIKRNEDDELFVPIDNDTIIVTSEGIIKSPVGKVNGVELTDDKNTEEIKVTWYGTQEEYNALPEKNPYTLYVVDTSEGYIPMIPDYNNAANKPKINGVELSGNKTISDLGLQAILTNGVGLALGNNKLDVKISGCLKVDSSNNLYVDLSALPGYEAINNISTLPRDIQPYQILVNDGTIHWKTVTPNV